MDGAYENKNTFQLNYHLKVNVSRIFFTHIASLLTFHFSTLSVLRFSEQFFTCLHLLRPPVSEGEKLSRQRTVYSDVFKTKILTRHQSTVLYFSARLEVK